MITTQIINQPDSDAKIVNAARVSMNKAIVPEAFDVKDARLLTYLAEHDHWTPFSHVRETFSPRVPFDLKYGETVLINALGDIPLNLRAGLVVDSELNMVRTSLYGWVCLLENDCIAPELFTPIINVLCEKYPHSMAAFGFAPHPQDPCWAEYDVSNENSRQPEFIDVTFRENVPIYVARQRFKHKVGFTENEISRRYVSETPEMFNPTIWRTKPEGSIKQGSGGPHPESHNISNAVETFHQNAIDLYENLLAADICPEQARGVLPQNMMTSYFVTGSLADYARLCHLRLDGHAQVEIQQLAEQIDSGLAHHPSHDLIWNHLMGRETTNGQTEEVA